MKYSMNSFRIPLIYGTLIVIIKVVSIDYFVCHECFLFINDKSIISVALVINLLIVIYKGIQVRVSLTEDDFNASNYSSNLFKLIGMSLFFSVLSILVLGSLWVNAQNNPLPYDDNIELFAAAFLIYILALTLLHPLRVMMIHVRRRIR